MADTSVGAGISASWNQQGNKLINNNWEHLGASDITQYEINDIVTYLGDIYQCVLVADASVNSDRIPTNTAYWKKLSGIGDDGRGIKNFSQSGNTITITLTDDEEFSFTLVETNDVVAGQSTYVDDIKALGDTALQSVPSEYLTQTEGDARYLENATVDVIGDTLYLKDDTDGIISQTDLGKPTKVSDLDNDSDFISESDADTRYIEETERSDFATAAQGTKADSALQVVPTTYITRDDSDIRYIRENERSDFATGVEGDLATSALQQSDVSVSGATLTIGTENINLGGGGGTSSNSESVVAWLKNSGSKVFNFVGGELSSFTITATDASVWTQALNFTAGDLTSITYTHNSGNVSVWEDTVITKTFNYTNGELSSIDYDRS